MFSGSWNVQPSNLKEAVPTAPLLIVANSRSLIAVPLIEVGNVQPVTVAVISSARPFDNVP